MNPYEPPATALPEPAPAASKRFRFVPVLVGGALIDFLGTNVVGFILASVVAAVLLAQGVSGGEVEKDLTTNPLLLAASYGLGAGLTLLGGYVAARWAGLRFVLHGAAAGALSLALGLPFLFMATPWDWFVYVGLTIQVPLAAAGGWLAARRVA
ncbi:MAG TPA: hypothetical protein VFT98_07650 [Myxococcota bacterium]|nr:hypothetical protein [Myxococcota bacterium]